MPPKQQAKAAAEPAATEPVHETQPEAEAPPQAAIVAEPEAAPPELRGAVKPRPAERTGERRGRPRFVPRRKVCSFCVEHVTSIDYKNTDRLKRFLSERGKIEPRRKTGTCAKHQRMLALALKRARHLALLPYSLQHILESGVEVGFHRGY